MVHFTAFQCFLQRFEKDQLTMPTTKLNLTLHTSWQYIKHPTAEEYGLLSMTLFSSYIENFVYCLILKWTTRREMTTLDSRMLNFEAHTECAFPVTCALTFISTNPCIKDFLCQCVAFQGNTYSMLLQPVNYISVRTTINKSSTSSQLISNVFGVNYI